MSCDKLTVHVIFIKTRIIMFISNIFALRLNNVLVPRMLLPSLFCNDVAGMCLFLLSATLLGRTCCFKVFSNVLKAHCICSFNHGCMQHVFEVLPPMSTYVLLAFLRAYLQTACCQYNEGNWASSRCRNGKV